MNFYTVLVEGLDGLDQVERLKDSYRRFAMMAINKTATSGRKQSADRIYDEIAFPQGYLNPSTKRLYVSQLARESTLEARIRARSRATSLARFATGNPQINKAGVTVEVIPGKAKHLPRAFVVKLRAGADVETHHNLGLAVRLPKGQVIKNKREVVQLDKGFYLLYGPSVDEIFKARDKSGVAEDISPELKVMLEEEFERLVDSLGRR